MPSIRPITIALAAAVVGCSAERSSTAPSEPSTTETSHDRREAINAAPSPRQPAQTEATADALSEAPAEFRIPVAEVISSDSIQSACGRPAKRNALMVPEDIGPHRTSLSTFSFGPEGLLSAGMTWTRDTALKAPRPTDTNIEDVSVGVPARILDRQSAGGSSVVLEFQHQHLNVYLSVRPTGQVPGSSLCSRQKLVSLGTSVFARLPEQIPPPPD